MKSVLILLSVVFLFFSCQDTWEKQGVDPEALHKGFAYDVLQNRGNYTLFLAAADKAGYGSLLRGKGLATVFAPDDNTFKAYLEKHNYSGLDAITPQELNVLIGQHVLKYSYLKKDLINFQPSVSGTGVIQPAGACYKHKTFAREEDETFYDAWEKRNVKVVNREKFLPVFSSDFFKTMKIEDPEADYKYFYSDSKWYGKDNCFYPANAGVLEYEIPTDNGYVYIVNQVIEPMRTVYSVLEDPKLNYSSIKGMFDSFSSFRYDAVISTGYAQPGDSLFLFEHMNEGRLLIENIASEWITNANNTEVQTLFAFNAFMPNDAAILQFFNDFFKDPDVRDQYNSLAEVDRLTLYYFLANHIVRSNPIFPSMLKDGVSDGWGGAFDLNLNSDVDHREICGNGVFYGLNKVQMPAIFNAVTRPVFQSPKYKMFAYALMRSGMLPELANKERRVTMLVLSDATMQSNGFALLDKNAFKVGEEEISLSGKVLLAQDLTNIVGNYVISEIITPEQISSGGMKKEYYETNRKDNFIYLYDGNFYSEKGQVIAKGLDEFNVDGRYGSWRAYELNGAIQGEDRAFLKVIDFNTFNGSEPYITWFSNVYKECICKKTDYFNVNQENNYKSFLNNRGVLFMAMDTWTKAGDKKIKDGIGIPQPNDKDKKPMSQWLEKHMIRREENKDFKLVDFMTGDLAGKEFHTMDPAFNIKVVNVEEGDYQIGGQPAGSFKLTLQLPEQENNREVTVYGPHFSRDAIFFIIPTAEDRFVWEIKKDEPGVVLKAKR